MPAKHSMVGQWGHRPLSPFRPPFTQPTHFFPFFFVYFYFNHWFTPSNISSCLSSMSIHIIHNNYNIYICLFFNYYIIIYLFIIMIPMPKWWHHRFEYVPRRRRASQKRLSKERWPPPRPRSAAPASPSVPPAQVRLRSLSLTLMVVADDPCSRICLFATLSALIRLMRWFKVLAISLLASLSIWWTSKLK